MKRALVLVDTHSTAICEALYRVQAAAAAWPESATSADLLAACQAAALEAARIPPSDSLRLIGAPSGRF